MIRKKHLQVLIHALQIVCVLGENSSTDWGRNETANELPNVSSFDYTEQEAFSGINDSYAVETLSIENFLNAKAELEQNEISMNNRLKVKNVNASILEPTINDLNKEFKPDLTLYDELKNNEILFDNKSLMCNETDGRNVQNLTIALVGIEWILLSWQPPCENANEPFTYSIDICLNKECSPKNRTVENDTQYNITGLDPCNDYTFTVKVINNDAESNGVSVVGTTSYNISEIGEIRELGVHTAINTITLNWKPPENYPTCVNNYLITQCVEDTCYNTTVVHETYVATDLKPCQKYFFIIRAVSYLIQSNGFNITLKTNSPKSSKPLYPTVEANAFSLFVHWQPPEVGALCVKHYRVTIDPQKTAKEIAGTNVTLTDLYACTPYFINITAVDEDNNDGETVTMPARTAATVSKSPELNTKEPIVTTNEIMLSWKIEKGNSNCTLKSLIAVCNSTSTSGHGYEIKNGKVEVLINSRIQDEFLIVNSMIKDVSPFTTYICWSYVINEAGNSELSNLISVTTLEDIPSAPLISVVNITYSQFIFVWESPTYLPGNLHQFEIIFQGKIGFPRPIWCEEMHMKVVKRLNGSIFNFEYLEAKAYTNYTAKIRAKTTPGWGNYSNDYIFQTPAGVPGKVPSFSYLIVNNENDTNILDTILAWKFPCSLNGILEYFNIFINGTRTNYAPHSNSIQKYISSDISKDDIISINLGELKAEYNYTFEVFAKVKDVEEFGIPTSLHVLYPAGIPPEPNEEYMKSITIDPANARRSTTSATLLLPLFDDTNGDIAYYSIIVSRIESNTSISTRFNTTNHRWPNIASWEEAMLQDFMIPYQATRVWWNPYPNYVADYGDVKAVKYTIGEDTNCKDISSNNKKVYCNGPLKPNTWYHVRMRGFTHGGYTDSKAFLIKTNAEINIPLVTGIVFGILILGIVTTVMLLVRRCSPYVILRRFLHSDMSASPVPAPFSRKKFIAHCQQLIDNPGKLSNEFQLLQTLSVDLQMPTNCACLQANKKKNRYADILPYDFSRVKLEVIDNDPNTDYINASFIKGYSGEDEYIACQGPKEETTFDFWRMIEQYNINMIVMLTELIEKGKEKCHQYFPTIRETFKYESMTIKCTSELDYRSYTQRTLVLQKENKKRNIIHLQFKEWPDHDVPGDFEPMIHFCQIMRRNTTATKEYIVIHCSAGVGRTGTLIAIDIILQHLRDNRKLDVFGTVYRLRHQRINMVQKESQYAYIYNCIKQVLKNPYCLKSYKPPSMDPICDTNSKKTRIVSSSNINLVNNFEMCM